MRSKANSQRLEGHVSERMVNGKKTRFLDDEACEILKAASRQSETIVQIEDQRELVASLREEKEEMLKELNKVYKELSEARQQMITSQQTNARIGVLEEQVGGLRAELEREQQRGAERREQIKDLRDQIEVERGRTAEAEERERIAEERAEKLKSRGLWARIRNVDV